MRKAIGTLLALAMLLTLALPALGEGPVEIRFCTYSDDYRMEALNALISAFEAENPGIKIVVEQTPVASHYEKKLAETASGTLPDIWELVPGSGSYWLENDLLLNLDGYVAADDTLNIEDFDTAMTGYFQIDGALLGIPYDLNGGALYYNKDPLDAAGLEYPNAGWTVDDLYEAMKKGVEVNSTQEKAVYGLSTLIPTGWLGTSVIDAFGISLVNEEGRIGVDDPATVEMLNWWLKCMEENLVPTPEPTNPSAVITAGSTTFANGQAMFHIGYSSIVAVAKESGINYGIAPFPAGPTGVRGAKLGGGFVITKAGKHPEEAYRFLSYIMSNDGMKAWIVDTNAGIPTRTALLAYIDPDTREFADAISEGYTWLNAVVGCNQVWTLKDTLLQELWVGRLTPEALIEQLVEEGNEVLEDAQ